MGRRQKNARDRWKDVMRLSKGGWNLEISSPPPLRTLTRSARIEIERQRAPSQWIYPAAQSPARRQNESTYPEASFMGLPRELRQQILYMSHTMQDLEKELAAGLSKGQLLLGYYPDSYKYLPTTKNIQDAINDQLPRLQLSRHRATLIVALNYRMEALSSLSPLIAGDMEYVSNQWQKDFETYIGHKLESHPARTPLKLGNVAAALEKLHNRAFTFPFKKQTVEEPSHGKKPRSKRHRAAKCWYCMERHHDGDLVCPQARVDPVQWKKKTKKVKGWEGQFARSATNQGKKTYFDD